VSAFDHLAHLARHQALFLDRVQLILDQPEPAIPPYRAEQDSEWREWRQRSLTRIIGRLHADRRRLADVVDHLSPQHLGRVGVHGVFGALSLAAWLEFFLAHAGHHFYVAFKRAHEVHDARW
jgi:DinB superfamily